MLKYALVSYLACLAVSASVFAVAVPVPVPGDAPVAVDRLRPGNLAILPMTGVWRFKLDQGMSPAVEGILPADAPIPTTGHPGAA